jgi:hypothetical protein
VYKNKLDEEWDQFQKVVKEATLVSNGRSLI